MQLAISALGQKSDEFVVEILSTISLCHCSVLELRTANLTRMTSIYLLVDGNWNHVAKLEGLLEVVKTRFQMQISVLRPNDDETGRKPLTGVPYTLETISVEKKDLLFAVTSFLTERGILVEEVAASRHNDGVFNNTIFSSKFLLLVPPEVGILSLREEFLDFCDSLNIDAILEPIKR